MQVTGCEERINNLAEIEHMGNNHRADHKRRRESHTDPKHLIRL